ncbi:MAG: hypothetical protein IJP63_00290 [Acholeplasmatales bacterium]|nr:hypothetical protein [Acholeplasmatales bacterium]
MNDNTDHFVYSESLKQLTDMTKAIMEQMRKSIEPLSASLAEASQRIKEYYEPIKHIGDVINNALQPFKESVEKALNNPNSVLSWFDYYKVLSKCFWIFPYNISIDELRKITKEDVSEVQFDNYMINHFTNELLLMLKKDTLNILPEKHKLLYSQTFDSFFNENYALCNLGLISIVDDLTSFYLENKGCTKRNGLLQPIVDLIKHIDFSRITEKHIIMLMINENINMLYINHDFNNDISIRTNKDVNRHTSMHGKYYSNKKASSLMLLNTIYYLSIVNYDFSNFENSIIYSKNIAKFKDKNKDYSLLI